MSANTSAEVRKSGVSRLPRSLASIYEQRWLLWYLAQRQLTSSSRGTFLGLGWLIIGPLMFAVLYTLIFSEMIGIRFRQTQSVANFGLYIYCGLIPFIAFSECVSKSINLVKGNSGLVQRVVFPLEILPLSTTVTSFLNQICNLSALLVLVAILEQDINWTLVYIPLVMIPQMLFNVGLGSLAAVLGAYLPDLKEAMKAIIRSLLFITPIIWAEDRLSQDSPFRPLIDYNPLAFFVRTYRSLILEGNPPDWSNYMWFTSVSLALAVLGMTVFVLVKNRFADLL